MGEVYKAVDTRLHRTVAIKTIDARFSDRFQREALAIASLNHPHVCHLYDVGPDYLVMEFVEGNPLHGPLPAREAIAFALQMCDALDAAHRKSITHRDLKPGNILVTTSGIKLLDFGLALLHRDAGDVPGSAEAAATLVVTQPGTVVGTAAYMSPEQARGEDVDARSDIFSFGIVFYEMLSGRRPFAGMCSADVVSSILRDDPAPLEGPAPVRAIVSRCLCKSPDGRFQTIRDVREAIEHAMAGSADTPPSIAVLPFTNMSADKEQEYFSDGLAEEIINALAKIPGIKVIARTSAFAFKGQNVDIRRIAETLGVANMLEGSVRRSGNRIRVTAQLITASDGSHLWSERYDREMADVFEVQDDIATAIANALEIKLSPTSAESRHTPAVPAYEALLKARHFHWKVTAESMEQARIFYEQAIALDPQFALAHALYADYLFGRTTIGLSATREVAPQIRESARRALELDPTLVDAHGPLLMIAATCDYDWTEAARRFTLATSGGVPSPLTRMGIGWGYFLGSGQLDQAVEQLELAVQGDPLHLTYRALLALALGASRRYADAEELLQQSTALDPNFFWTHAFTADLHVARGMFDRALDPAGRAFTLAPWYTPSVGVYAGLLARTGKGDRGRALLDRFDANGYGVPVGWALFHICGGEVDLATDWFAKAIEQRYSLVGAYLRSAITEPLRASAHWPRLAGMMNLASG